jgi:ribosomal protein L40E
MKDNLFGGLGNILGGIAKSVVPKDTPEGKLLNAQSDLSDLKNKEAELLQAIGKKAYEQNPTAWEEDSQLKLVRQSMADAQKLLDEAQTSMKNAEAEKEALEASLTCPNCSYYNPEGTKFCQQCGSKLGITKVFCTSCNAELAPGTSFCGTCGAKQGV